MLVRHNNLEITLPETGWSDVTTVAIHGPSTGGFNVAIAICSLASTCSTVAEVVEKELPKLKKALKPFKSIAQNPSTFGDNTGHVLEFETVVKGAKLRYLQFFMLKDGVAYTFAFAHTAAAFEASRASFQEILKTVKI